MCAWLIVSFIECSLMCALGTLRIRLKVAQGGEERLVCGGIIFLPNFKLSAFHMQHGFASSLLAMLNLGKQHKGDSRITKRK